MGERLPINFLELVQVAALGVNPDSIRFENATMESDKFVCVKEGSGIVVVDLANGYRVTRYV